MSDLLETLRSRREFSNYIASVANSSLYRHGQLLETRRIKDIQKLKDTVVTEAG
ncbi:hypothetical protein RSK20926_02007 [Roseobacter sp. SK209-2-6]|uniref:hypothetical protein n=1 Tax=Roseobacter sp. SK209-2-6 TaxID=388739 RepID=UPI0000F3F543|nr:hypothetical protein [Roseobacter sp. SK209-2-6]EBA14762.1 hypothetical protein RSK20926_02007 [Roseobacter sp. SK209-2-6]